MPTMVFSSDGMNFKGMPGLAQPAGYPIMPTCTALACVGLYRRLRKSGWI